MEETMSTMEYALRAKSILNRPEANAKLTKKAVLTEFTKEIEQLKSDLRAAREKNGVFLSAERHAEMHQNLASQKDEIEELSASITARTEELKKIQALFATTEAELQVTSASLKETRTVLDETEIARAQAEDDKVEAEAARDEAKYVLGETQTTESVLHRQATGLVDVAQTTSSHVDALHAKVSRAVEVTETNQQVAHTAKDMILKGITTASHRAQIFEEKQSEQLGSMRCDVASFVHSMTIRMAELKSELAEIKAESTGSLCTAYAGATASSAIVNGTAQACTETSTTDAEELIETVSDFAARQYPRTQRVLRSQIDQHSRLTNTFAKQVRVSYASPSSGCIVRCAAACLIHTVYEHALCDGLSCVNDFIYTPPYPTTLLPRPVHRSSSSSILCSAEWKSLQLVPRQRWPS
jgi:hypothetical protein